VYLECSEIVTDCLFKITLIISSSLASFFVIPLTFLVIVQTQNFLLNQTTNKRFSKFKRPIASNDQLLAGVHILNDSEEEEDDFKNTEL
jgi:hypothetical protein